MTADFYDAWNPGAPPIAGGSSVVANFASDPMHLPLYFQAGAIVPMNIEDDVTGFGDAAQKGALTLLLYPSLTASSFTLHEIDDTTTVITSQKIGAGFHVTLARAVNPVFFSALCGMESAPERRHARRRAATPMHSRAISVRRRGRFDTFTTKRTRSCGREFPPAAATTLDAD